jgi:two-component system sensor histidine kinase YesM
MVDDIRVYIDAIYNEAENVKNAETAALKFQLESLQQQINPHFLYNTLNTIKYLATQGRTKDIAELIQSLNMLLRSSISNMQAFRTIAQEIFFLEAYVKIQAYRYPDMINFHISSDDNALDFTIPKLILQPLVENAIIHGLFPRQQKGNIKLKLWQTSNCVVIRIEDDGVGMDSKIVEKLNLGEFLGESIGVQNVYKRLKIYYGDSARLVYSSTQDKGTTVELRLPLEPKED